MLQSTITAKADKQDNFETVAAPDPFFSDSNMAYVKKSVQELQDGKGTAHELIEVKG